MRMLLKFTSTILFSLSLCLATITLVIALAPAARAQDPNCNFTVDPVVGIVCKADRCGFWNFFHCSRRQMFDPITGQLLSDICDCF